MQPPKTRLPEQGLSRQAVAEQMRERKRADADWEGGRLFSLIYPAGEDVDEVLRYHAEDEIFAKTGFGLVYWRPELCLGQHRLMNTQVDLGLREGGYVFFLGLIGIREPAALAFGLVWFTIMVLGALPGGLLLLLRDGRGRQRSSEVGQ